MESHRTVTGLRPTGVGRVQIELDGVGWRVVPAEAARRAGLEVGAELDRGRLRLLRGELGRAAAREAALRALRYRDHTAAGLETVLERKGIRPAVRHEAVARLQAAGLVDDGRLAVARAAALAERGAGDDLVRADLERRGVPAALATEAIAALEPEPERAERILARRGRDARALRYLSARGFTEETVSALVADGNDVEIR